ncbi:MAG TPA: phosphotransferase [Vicinamibacterales bacterium]|nr:phosphotransferase [Vicinamibacterales bacterium]
MNVEATPAAEPLSRIARYLETAGLAGRNPRILPLTPDASDRRYFRVRLDDAPPLVLAVYAGPIEFATMPFANVADLLQRMDLPAPAVLAHADALGIVAQEDLGDVTLQAHLGADRVSDHLPLYREAVTLIHRLQEGGRRLASPSWVPFTLAFDVEKLTFELNFFQQHFLEGHRRAWLTAAEKAALSEEWAAIADELSAEPRVLCHRDYHSRNLMLHDGRLHLIDFQDARLGPDTYDLVSLLRDSYVDVTPQEVDRLMAWFTELSGIVDRAEFRRRFDLMAVQRNIKALGTFGFQAFARNNDAYLQYVPRTLRSIRDNLEKHHRFARLRGLLAAHVEELR